MAGDTMTVYYAEFNGRTKGAIGVFYRIRHLTAGVDPEAAKLKLYDWFEHIQGLSLTPLVLRYYIVTASGDPFYPRQGRYTWETKEEIEPLIDQIKANNSEKRLQEMFGDPSQLRAVGVWCWPGHFDPAVGEGWPFDAEGSSDGAK